MTKTDDRQQHLFDVAEAQAGYFSLAQAKKAGYSQPLVVHHVTSGTFRRIKHGIYRLTRFPTSPHEDLFIAWLQTGQTGVFSHDTALALWGLSDWIPSAIHLTVPPNSSRRRSGFRLHFAALDRCEVIQREGLPVTTLERTFRDVARTGLSDEFLIDAMREATQRTLISRTALESLAQRPYSRAGKTARLALAPTSTSAQN